MNQGGHERGEEGRRTRRELAPLCAAQSCLLFGLASSSLLPISNESETRTQIKVDGEKIGGGGRERVKAVGALTLRPPKDNFKAQTRDLLLDRPMPV